MVNILKRLLNQYKDLNFQETVFNILNDIKFLP